MDPEACAPETEVAQVLQREQSWGESGCSLVPNGLILSEVEKLQPSEAAEGRGQGLNAVYDKGGEVPIGQLLVYLTDRFTPQFLMVLPPGRLEFVIHQTEEAEPSQSPQGGRERPWGSGPEANLPKVQVREPRQLRERRLEHLWAYTEVAVLYVEVTEVPEERERRYHREPQLNRTPANHNHLQLGNRG